jgi:hypothetical protein
VQHRTWGMAPCRHCATGFIKDHVHRAFCSEECKAESIRLRRATPLRPRACVGCGAEFAPTGPTQQYCTKSCRASILRASKPLKPARPRLNRQETPVGQRVPGAASEMRTCEACGVGFDTAIRRTTAAARACSRRCADWARKNPGVALSPRTCLACGVDISHRATNAKHCSDSRCSQWTREHPGQPLPQRQCAACGVDISHRTLKARVCGAARCYGWTRRHPGRAMPAARSRECPACGASLDGRDPNAMYCDRLCGDWARRHPGKPRPSGERECLICGVDISSYPIISKWCSVACNRQSPAYLAMAAATRARRRAAKRGARTLKFSMDELAARLATNGNKCYVCGSSADTVDHVKPVMRTGWHALSNMRPMCRRCNCIKGHAWPIPTALLRPGGAPEDRVQLLRDFAKDCRRMTPADHMTRKGAA